jgi:hypothetical protein
MQSRFNPDWRAWEARFLGEIYLHCDYLVFRHTSHISMPRPSCGCDGDPRAIKDVGNVWEGCNCVEIINLVSQWQLNVNLGTKIDSPAVSDPSFVAGCSSGIGGCGLRWRFEAEVDHSWWHVFCWWTKNQSSFDYADGFCSQNRTDDAGWQCEENVVLRLVIGGVLMESQGVEDEGIDQFDSSNWSGCELWTIARFIRFLRSADGWWLMAGCTSAWVVVDIAKVTRTNLQLFTFFIFVKWFRDIEMSLSKQKVPITLRQVTCQWHIQLVCHCQ